MLHEYTAASIQDTITNLSKLAGRNPDGTLHDKITISGLSLMVGTTPNTLTIDGFYSIPFQRTSHLMTYQMADYIAQAMVIMQYKIINKAIALARTDVEVKKLERSRTTRSAPATHGGEHEAEKESVGAR